MCLQAEPRNTQYAYICDDVNAAQDFTLLLSASHLTGLNNVDYNHDAGNTISRGSHMAPFGCSTPRGHCVPCANVSLKAA